MSKVVNWNTDVTRFPNQHARRKWELTQLIDYGTQGQKLSKEELKEYWDEIKHEIDPAMRRLLEYCLWDKVSLLPTSNSFWDKFIPLR